MPLSSIICVGENLDDRNNKKALDFVKEQILSSIPVTKNEMESIAWNQFGQLELG